MAEITKIAWATSSWNPWYGCTKVSPACDNCYSERWAERWGYPFNKVQVASSQTFNVPKNWRKKRIFVCSLSDFFHPDMWKDIKRDIFILPSIGYSAIKLMIKSDSNTWLILTKRPENIQSCLKTTPWAEKIPHNVWLGVTAENQEQADKRIPELLKTSADIKFVSCEPLLSPIELSTYLPQLSWCIAGGESGNKKTIRPTAKAWFEDIFSQCQKAGVPFFFKQYGSTYSQEPAICADCKEYPL